MKNLLKKIITSALLVLSICNLGACSQKETNQTTIQITEEVTTENPNLIKYILIDANDYYYDEVFIVDYEAREKTKLQQDEVQYQYDVKGLYEKFKSCELSLIVTYDPDTLTATVTKKLTVDQGDMIYIFDYEPEIGTNCAILFNKRT